MPSPGAAQTRPAVRDGALPDFTIHVFGDAAADFSSKVAGYAELRARLEAGLPPVIVTDDVRELRRGRHRLAQAIRRARRGAVQGDIFTDATSALFKQVLAATMNPALWTLIMEENPEAFRHDIDSPYPDGKPYATMPAVILSRLPRLPDDIQYRFVGSHLILYDVRANTIIDQLDDAIACARGCSR